MCGVTSPHNLFSRVIAAAKLEYLVGVDDLLIDGTSDVGIPVTVGIESAINPNSTILAAQLRCQVIEY